MKIKIKLYEGAKMPEINPKGDWIDVFSNKNIVLVSPFANTLHDNRTRRTVEFTNLKVGLGFAMELPKGFEAILAPRSSSFKTWGICLPNSFGIIDASYNGNDDEWKMTCLCYKDEMINKGDKIGQFRIQLSQKATFWQKLKWLFWNGKIEFVQVDDLGNEARGGFGSTGSK